MDLFGELMGIMEGVALYDREDSMHSAYAVLSFSVVGEPIGNQDLVSYLKVVWKSWAPFKVKLLLDRIPTRDNICKRMV